MAASGISYPNGRRSRTATQYRERPAAPWRSARMPRSTPLVLQSHSRGVDVPLTRDQRGEDDEHTQSMYTAHV